MKKYFFLPTILALALLVGAGCSSDNSATPNTSQNETPAVSTSTNTANTNDFTLNAEKTSETATVKLSWKLPASVDASLVRVMHSSQPDPTLPTDSGTPQPFWQQLPTDTTEFVWSGIRKGTRYFRVCAWVNNECSAYSNTVELTVE